MSIEFEERERKREWREKEKNISVRENINWLPPICTHTRDRTCHPGMCPEWDWTPTSGCTEQHSNQQGHPARFKKRYFWYNVIWHYGDQMWKILGTENMKTQDVSWCRYHRGNVFSDWGCICFSKLKFSFLKNYFIYLFIFREGKGGRREGNINVWLLLTYPLLGTWPATQACA